MTELLSSAQIQVLILAPVLSAGLIRLLMMAAPKWDLMDRPGHRKVHNHPTPLVGGIGILATVVALQLVTGRVPFDSLSFLVALAIILAIGVADDAHEVSHRAKFVAQALGGIIIVSGTSVWVTSLGDLVGLGDVELGKWAILVTVVSIVGVMNAVNMIDGLDGLAGSVSLMPLLVLAAVSFADGQAGLGFELLLIFAAVAGFLALNLRLPGRERALVFMGDTGGMVIGIFLAWYSIKLAGSASAPIKPITAVWILAMPLLDMGSVMLVRLMQKTSPFHADQQHMHHVLLHGGYSANQIVALMSIASLLFGVVGILCERQGVSEVTMFFVFLALWAAYVLALKNPSATRAMARRIVSPVVYPAESAR